ncbi:hypothetical protein EP7_001212 [Isosphaeraceae bacterium EP7]
MVCTRRRALLALIVVASAFATSLARAEDSKPATPTERTPYAIRVSLSTAPEARIDPKGRAALVASWRDLVNRFVGSPWKLDVVDGEGELAVSLGSIDPASLSEPAKGADRLWLIRVEPSGTGLDVSGRSFDPETATLGPIHLRTAIVPAELPRALFRVALDLFVPSARIDESAAGGVSITVQGAGLAAASPLGQVVAPGTVFRPYRIFQSPDGATLKIDEIRWSYLKVDSLAGAVARCSIVSGLRDPLTRRVARRNRLIARGVKPSDQPTLFRFTTEPDKAPAAGYVLTARTVPDGAPFEVGTTDRDGRIALGPGVRRELLVFRLLSGSVEPMVEFPAMPGDVSGEHTIPFDPKTLTVALEIQLDSLKDAIVDVVAVRARLESRLKARLAGSDWNAADESLAEFRKLTPKASFADRLAKLKDEAARKQAATKTPILTKTAQAQVADVQALIDRYLDDEAFNAYAEAIAQGRAAPAEGKDKSKAAKKTAGTEIPKVLPGAAAFAQPESVTEPAAPAEVPAAPAVKKPAPAKGGVPF